VLTGKGWVGGSTVRISPPGLSDFQAQNLTPKPDANGSWKVTVKVGASPPGSYVFTFTQNGCPSQTAAFTVTLAKSSCSSVWLVGARGSGEPASGNDGMGLELHNMAKVLKTDLAAKGKNLQLMPVFYPADSAYELIPSSSSEFVQDLLSGPLAVAAAAYEAAYIAKYDLSINQGIQGTEQAVATILRLCPGAKIVLAGYSQGAIAVHEAENSLHANKPGELKQHIVGTLLLADPDRAPNTGPKNQRVTEFGTSQTSKSATAPVGLRVAVRLVKAQQVPLPGSTANIANTDDIVGDFSWSHFEGKSIAQVVANFQNAVRVHTSYANDPALTAAVNWVASKIH
jgi:cutinase